MTSKLFILCGTCMSLSALQIAVAETRLAPIEVEANAEVVSTVSILSDAIESTVDTSELLKRIPGASVNKNGPLTGIPQYRGMFGDRVNVNTDGVNIKAAGPNSMDPAISHLPPSLTEEVYLERGIAAVSSGIETIGNSISVKSKSAEFGFDQQSETHGTFKIGVSTVDTGKKAALFLSNANKNYKIYTGLSSESGQSFKFKEGTNVNTEYDRDAYLLGYGLQSDDGKHQFNLKYNYNNTGETGTPALPMDIVYVESGVFSGDYTIQINEDTKLSALLSSQNSDHLMNNYLFRHVDAPQRRYALTDVKADSYKILLEKMQGDTQLKLGLEGDRSAHQAYIFNPDQANFKITNYDVERNRHSLFVELSKTLKDGFNIQTGLRYSQVKMDANDVNSSLAANNALHNTLQNRFNASDRRNTDHNMDFVINVDQQISKKLSLSYGVAHKMRSPSYQERYLWLPLESTAGLADGNRYVGNPDLKPEKAIQLELGAKLNTANGGYIAPQMFYHQVDDYIQGTPSTKSPIPPNALSFNNVDAVLYGFDVDFYHKIKPSFFVDGTLSYVRGKRRDNSDNLYRISPMNARIGVHYKQAKWSTSAEIEAYAKQDKVAANNSEQATAGYALLNLQGEYQLQKNLKLSLGVNNVLDKHYSSHLGAYNRNNQNSDVGFNASNYQAFRLPEAGRNVFASIKYEW